jgi:ubiquinone/menaquinone biosynthesis C-methylase UbiE
MTGSVAISIRNLSVNPLISELKNLARKLYLGSPQRQFQCCKIISDASGLDFLDSLSMETGSSWKFSMDRFRPNHHDMKRFYDERYDLAYMEEHPEIELIKVKDTLERIREPIHSVLDFGCGQGACTALLSTVFPKAKISGVDISEIAIKKAAERFPEHGFFLFDGEITPFKDNSFDLVFSYHVLEHVHAVEASVREICRIARKDAFLCVILPCINPAIKKINNL